MAEKYFVITESMIDLDLSSKELMVFAIINGFSQDGESWFYGARSYLAKWTKTSIPQIQRILESLIERKLLVKKFKIENNIKQCFYRAVFPQENENVEDQKQNHSDTGGSIIETSPVSPRYGGSIKMIRGQYQDDMGGSITMIHNNISNNKIDNKVISKADSQLTTPTTNNNNDDKSSLDKFAEEKGLSFSEQSKKVIEKRLLDIGLKDDFLTYVWLQVIAKYPDKTKAEVQKLFISAVTTWGDMVDGFEIAKKEEEKKNNPWLKWGRIKPPRICQCGKSLNPPIMEQGETMSKCECGKIAIYDFYSEDGWIWV